MDDVQNPKAVIEAAIQQYNAAKGSNEQIRIVWSGFGQSVDAKDKPSNNLACGLLKLWQEDFHFAIWNPANLHSGSWWASIHTSFPVCRLLRDIDQWDGLRSSVEQPFHAMSKVGDKEIVFFGVDVCLPVEGFGSRQLHDAVYGLLSARGRLLFAIDKAKDRSPNRRGPSALV